MPSSQDSHTERHVAVAKTNRPDTPELEGGIPLPEELTGRAASTIEDVSALFASEDATHLADGFRGGSDDDEGSDLARDPDSESVHPNDHLPHTTHE